MKSFSNKGKRKKKIKYFFITNFDKDKSEKYKAAWIEFQAVVDSNSKMLDINYDSKNRYKNRLKIFEDDFINKLRRSPPAGASVTDRKL